jgi:hypothetical protein
MSPRRRGERAWEGTPGWVRWVTLLVLAVGAVLAVWAWSAPERRQERKLEALALGEDTAVVRALLGEPVRCPVGRLAHLAAHLPAGTPPAEAARVVEALRARTVVRWVFPIRARVEARCDASRGQTEVGLDREGRVVWIVPVTGRSPLRAPPELSPTLR